LDLVRAVKDGIFADVVVVAFEGRSLHPPRHILNHGAVDSPRSAGRVDTVEPERFSGQIMGPIAIPLNEHAILRFDVDVDCSTIDRGCLVGKLVECLK